MIPITTRVSSSRRRKERKKNIGVSAIMARHQRLETAGDCIHRDGLALSLVGKWK